MLRGWAGSVQVAKHSDYLRGQAGLHCGVPEGGGWVGCLEPQYIVRRPPILNYSMERRLIPRHYVIKVLKAKGLPKKDPDFYSAVSLTEKRFVEKFIDRYRASVPGLRMLTVLLVLGKHLPHSNCENWNGDVKGPFHLMSWNLLMH